MEGGFVLLIQAQSSFCHITLFPGVNTLMPQGTDCSPSSVALITVTSRRQLSWNGVDVEFKSQLTWVPMPALSLTDGAFGQVTSPCRASESSSRKPWWLHLFHDVYKESCKVSGRSKCSMFYFLIIHFHEWLVAFSYSISMIFKPLLCPICFFNSKIVSFFHQIYIKKQEHLWQAHPLLWMAVGIVEEIILHFQ